MPGKPITMSVRLSPEDAAFLAEFSAPDATTPSDKLRAIIREARRNRTHDEGYAERLAFLEDLLAAPVRGLRETEAKTGRHSELVLQTAHWLPDLMAYLMSNVPAPETNDVEAGLKTLEVGVADRIFAFMEQIFRLGVTGESPTYDPGIVARHVTTVVKLCRFMDK